MVDEFSIEVNLPVASEPEVWSALRTFERLAKSVTPSKLSVGWWRVSDLERSFSRGSLDEAHEVADMHQLKRRSIHGFFRWKQGS
ncbi:hypothetical protein ACPW96_16795 [Micromonospora sp. DT81.3]